MIFKLRQACQEENDDKRYNCASMETDEAAPGRAQTVCSPDPSLSSSLRSLSLSPSRRLVNDSNSKIHHPMLQSFLEKCQAEPAAQSQKKERSITQIIVDTANDTTNDHTEMAIPKVINSTSSCTACASLPVLDTSGDSLDDEDDDTSMTTFSVTSEDEHHGEDALIETSSTTTSNSSGTTEAEPAVSDEIAVTDEVRQSKQKAFSPFTLFRMQYLIVHTAIMLADGLQGETERLLILSKNWFILQYAIDSFSHI